MKMMRQTRQTRSQIKSNGVCVRGVLPSLFIVDARLSTIYTFWCMSCGRIVTWCRLVTQGAKGQVNTQAGLLYVYFTHPFRE